MYAHFYHLTEQPFNLTPDPKYHYVNESTREAMANILHGIKSRKGFLTLIGEAGTGKTTLLKRIVDEIEGETQVVFVFNPGVSFDELLEFICTELGIETRGTKRLHLLEKLNAYLLEQLTDGRNVVVMIDESQTLKDDVLEELRLLSNLETAKEKILQILLAGQPELNDTLRRPNLRQLRQRIAVRATLEPMQADEIGAYIETRLRTAGADRNDLFTPGALKKIYQASDGIPRIINVTCDNAMMLAFAEGEHKITAKVVAEAVRDLHGGSKQSGMGDRVRELFASSILRYGAAALVGAALLLPLMMFVNRGEDSRDVETPVTKAPASDPRGDGSGLATSGSSVAANRADSNTAGRSQSHAENSSETSRRGAELGSADGFGERGAGNSDPRPDRSSDALRSSGDPTVGEGGLPARRPSVVNANDNVAGDGSLTPPSEERAGGSEDPDDVLATELSGDGIDSPPLGEGTSPSAEPIRDSMRHAREIAASTAQRLFGKNGRGDADIEAAAKASMRQEGALEASAKASVPKPEPLPELRPEVEAPRRIPTLDDPSSFELEPDPLLAEEAALMASRYEARKRGDVVTTNSGVAALLAGDENDDSSSEIVALPSNVQLLGPAAGEIMLGNQVKVGRGDTVWDIAVAHYGTAGPLTLSRILKHNPKIRDPRRLRRGVHIYLPFVRPEQMVQKDSDGSFRVLLATSPDPAAVNRSKGWVSKLRSESDLESVRVVGDGGMVKLYARGLPTRDAATEFATDVLEQHERLVLGSKSG